MKDSIKNMESLLRDVAPKRRSTIVWGTALVLAALPFVISTPLATEILIWAIFGIGFNLLLGYTGVLSFGHSAYFGMGAYGMGLALDTCMSASWADWRSGSSCRCSLPA